LIILTCELSRNAHFSLTNFEGFWWRPSLVETCQPNKFHFAFSRCVGDLLYDLSFTCVYRPYWIPFGIHSWESTIHPKLQGVGLQFLLCLILKHSNQVCIYAVLFFHYFIIIFYYVYMVDDCLDFSDLYRYCMHCCIIRHVRNKRGLRRVFCSFVFHNYAVCILRVFQWNL
jgi:hypothetical protein